MIRGVYSRDGRHRCGEYDLLVALVAMAVHDFRKGLRAFQPPPDKDRSAERLKEMIEARDKNRMAAMKARRKKGDYGRWACYRSALWFFFHKDSGFDNVMSVIEVSSSDVLKKLKREMHETLGHAQARREVQAILGV